MSDIYNQLIEILNNDPETQKIMTEVREAAIRTGATSEEFQKAKELMFMVCLKNNKQAFDMYAEYVYHELRGEN